MPHQEAPDRSNAASALGSQLPRITLPIPAARGAQLVEILAATESPAFTARRARRAEASGTPHDPIVWTEAIGSNVIDADGNRYVDLTAGFGAAAVGHRHPKVVAAIEAQSGKLLHALGDVHPSDTKIALLQRLKNLAPFDDARVALGLSGSDAIECALKTAALATRKHGVLAFIGGYHGLSHGPLAACGYREAFRAPFAPQLNPHVVFAPYPRKNDLAAIDQVIKRWDAAQTPIGAVLFEPVLGRGGVVTPPPTFAKQLSALCKERGALLIVDEILTGLGRCGETFVSIADGASPDLVCTGKALGGGLPISACIGTREAMSAWGDPNGEALHTGTFFGHPLSCATALASLDVIANEGLSDRALDVGGELLKKLTKLGNKHDGVVSDVRGRGLMIAVELRSTELGLRVVRQLLEAGYIALPAGPDARAISITPPLTISEALLDGFVDALHQVLKQCR